MTIFHCSKVLRDDSVFLGEPVDAIVRFTHSADSAADSVGLVGASHSAGGFIHISNVDLDRSVILSRNDSVAGRAEINK